MEDSGHSHDAKHQQRIKDVQIYLRREENPIVTLNVLDQSEQRPHKDQTARDVEHAHDAPPPPDVPPPSQIRLLVQDKVGHLVQEPAVEHGRCHDEEPKEDELHGQAQQDDGLARVHRLRLGEQARAHDLHQEGEDVADYEDLCEARGLDRGESGAVEVEDQAAEDHVDRGGEEGGRDEEAEGLDHEEAEVGGVGGGEIAADVACDFDCERCWSVVFGYHVVWLKLG